MKNSLRFCASLLFLSLIYTSSIGQAPRKPTSADIYESLQRLQVLGTALYVAAHPDDENTRLISYLSNHLKVRTAYLSLTRGDGGQNLIGPEIRELLGVIRTQELLAARRIDGGMQFFSRANDFGYSKHPDETFNIWDKDKVMADVIWTIRQFQPDVIINRFDHKTPGRTHGHHTASAMLSYDAFDKSGDPSIYPEQLQYTSPWSAKRLFFNTHYWFYGGREAFAKVDKSNMVKVDIGTYYPVKGKSNTEIAAESRSMHKCQGFGAIGTRGTQEEYLDLLKGDMPKDQGDIFEGINTTWTRVKGGAPIGKLLATIEQNFRYDDPAASVEGLLEVHQMVAALPDGYWKSVKLVELEQLIQDCMGFFAEAIVSDFSAAPGEEISLKLEVINRSKVKASLDRVEFLPFEVDSQKTTVLEDNVSFKEEYTFNIPTSLDYSNAYWLNQTGSLGMYTVAEQSMRGKPETPSAVKVKFHLTVVGRPLVIEKSAVFKKRDPVKGEVYRPFELTPPVFVNITEPVYVFGNASAKQVKVKVKAGKANAEGKVRLKVPEGWRSEPIEYDFNLGLKDQEQAFEFALFPPTQQSEGQIGAEAIMDGQSYPMAITLIEYDHIPVQTILSPCEARVVRLDLMKAGQRVGYIEGAGDAIPASLEQIGYEVTLLDPSNLTVEQLKTFDAVILGIRAFNTVDKLKFQNKVLFDYVEQGGTMIVQYNTNRSMVTKDVAPFALNVSRDRVTVEEAEVRMLQADHEVLNQPNKITSADFQNWVQERGLYFPNEWDDAFTAVLSSNDPGEPARDGGLLVAQHGKGYYIYTGYSWFRQLPAGVAGAYRLFTNLISIGKEARP